MLRSPRKVVRAPRYQWFLEHGPIPEGLNVCHRCDNPRCVNPGHLFLGTQLDNVRDMTAKGRRVDHLGEAHGRAKLRDSDVTDIRDRRAHGVFIGVLAREYGVAESTISEVAKGKTWRHVA